MTQLPLFPGTGIWVMVEVAGTESASTFHCWIPLPTVTDALALRVPAPPLVPLHEGGSAPLPAVIPCWWKRKMWTMLQWTLHTHHPQGPHPLGVKSVETHLLPPAIQGEAVTQMICKDATLRLETPSTWLGYRLSVVSSASHRKPGRHHWGRWSLEVHNPNK